MRKRTKLLEVDPIELILEKIVYNEQFDSQEWCLKDADRLEQAAKIIRDGLQDKHDHP